VETGGMSNRCAYLHESYRTLRDGSLGWRTCSRHFVPGYDRIVPLGHYFTALRTAENYASVARRDHRLVKSRNC
jgi:hypothetical protein